jgi:hypothetical protein
VRWRLALLLLGGASMLLGLAAGLMLLGLPVPITTERLLEVHGQLMIVGFLGTVIALERAIALRQAWAYAAPLATGVGALLLVTPLPIAVGLSVQALASGSSSPSTPPSGAVPRRPLWRSSGWAPSWPWPRACCGWRGCRPAHSSPSLPGFSC